MTQQHINLGTPPNGTDGDTNRTAWGKTEANFNELFGRPIASGKNLLINGSFDVWQRAVSSLASASARYVADRWGVAGSASTIAVSRQTFAVGQSDVPGSPAAFHRAVVASVAGASNYAVMYQKIEGMRTCAGQAVTLSFYAKADAPKNIAMEMVQGTGTGGSPSGGAVGIGARKFALTTAWQKFTATVPLPSAAGATLGTDGNDFLMLQFFMDAGSSFNSRTDNLGQQSGTFDIAQVQVEAGELATAFERRPLGIEVQLCQRYFEKSYDVATYPGASAFRGRVSIFVASSATGLASQVSTPFKVIKRALPAVVVYADNTGTANRVSQDDGSNVTPTVVQVGETGFYVSWVNTAGRYGGSYHYTADAEL